MIFFHKPDRIEIDRFIAAQRSLPFTYLAVGATARNNLPAGYVIDHHRVELGQGSSVYEQAKKAVREWQMFNFPWLQLCWPDAPIEKDVTVAVMANHMGFWSLNACRIVYAIDQEKDPAGLSRFGFAYGTLAEHAESGEERFTVEFDDATQSVCYDVLAFSRPNQLLSKLGYPLTRRLQKKFAADSMAAMLRAVQIAAE